MPPTPQATVSSDNSLEKIDSEITEVGNKIRELKSQKASKEVIDCEVKKLLALKASFKTAAGKDWDPKGCDCLFDYFGFVFISNSLFDNREQR